MTETQMQVTDWQPVELAESPSNICGFSETEISLYQKVSEDNEVLRKQIKELESRKSAQDAASEIVVWGKGILCFLIGAGLGWITFFYFSANGIYDSGYTAGRGHWREAFCLLKYKSSVSAFNDCNKQISPK